ncbi:MAG: DUF1178 family protein [Aquabacterium sp.]
MLVVDLNCERGHVFEGWFASGDELQSQQARGLLSCPVCGSHEVVRRPSAARLNVSSLKAAKLEGTRPPSAGSSTRDDRRGHDRPADRQAQGAALPAQHTPPDALDTHTHQEAADAMQTLQAMYLQAVRHVIAHTEDVGESFAEEVRSIHQGEAPQRAIRGQASAEEREALREEGIDVLSLPIPAALKGPLQ